MLIYRHLKLANYDSPISTPDSKNRGVITIVLQTALISSQPTHLIVPPVFFDNSLEEIKAPIREA